MQIATNPTCELADLNEITVQDFIENHSAQTSKSMMDSIYKAFISQSTLSETGRDTPVMRFYLHNRFPFVFYSICPEMATHESQIQPRLLTFSSNL